MKSSWASLITIALQFCLGSHALRFRQQALKHLGPPQFSRSRPEQQVLGPRSDPLSHDDSLFAYTIDVAVGTPPQNISLVLATELTGTAIPLWDPSFCNPDPELCHIYGMFNASRSSTFKNPRLAPPIEYVEDSPKLSILFEDAFTIGNEALGAATIWGYQSDFEVLPAGILGLGPTITDEDGNAHRGLLDDMVLQNLSSTRSYSIFFDDTENHDGEITFGTLDTSRYTGDLVALPALKPGLVALDSLTYGVHHNMTIAAAPKESSIMAMFSGLAADTISLPGPFVDSISNNLGVTSPEGFNCSLIPSGEYLTFTFQNKDGPAIQVPLSSAVQSFQNGVCSFQNSLDPDFVVLGGPFMRHAYTVFNWDTNEIAIAPSATRTNTSDVIPITGPHIPGAAVIHDNGTYSCPAPVPGRPLPSVCNSTINLTSATSPVSPPLHPCLVDPASCPSEDPCFMDPFNCTDGIPDYPSLSPRMNRQVLLASFVVMSVIIFLTPCILLVILQIGEGIGFGMADLIKSRVDGKMD